MDGDLESPGWDWKQRLDRDRQQYSKRDSGVGCGFGINTH